MERPNPAILNSEEEAFKQRMKWVVPLVWDYINAVNAEQLPRKIIEPTEGLQRTIVEIVLDNIKNGKG